MREGCKMTALGEIPNEWNVDKLKNISELIDGDRSGNYPSGDDIVQEGIIFLSTSNIKKDKLVFDDCKYITKEKFDSLRKGKLQDKDIIITLRGSLGNIGYFKEERFKTGFINAQMMIIRNNIEDINPEYLYKYLTSELIRKQIKSISTGSAQPQLTKRDVGEFTIAIPSLPEQQKIADILSTIDEQIDHVDRLIEKTKELKKGLMQQLLTKGIGHTEFKETEVGVIPKEWEVKKLEDISDFITKGATPTTYGYEWVEEGVLFLKSDCVSEEGFVMGDSMQISREAHEHMERSKVQCGDILISITGNIGKVCMLPENIKEANINQHIARIRIVDVGVNSNFIYYYLSQEKVRDNYNKIKTGLAYPQISLKQVRETLVVIPPIEEQQKIASIIFEADNKIEALKIRNNRLEQLKKGLMQQLLTGKIRVK